MHGKNVWLFMQLGCNVLFPLGRHERVQGALATAATMKETQGPPRSRAPHPTLTVHGMHAFIPPGGRKKERFHDTRTYDAGIHQ